MTKVHARPFAIALAGSLALSSLALSSLALSAGAALAQPQGSAQGQQPDLPSLLHLRPDQQGAYQAMLQADRPAPAEESAYRAASPQALGALRTPQRLDRIGAAMAAQMQTFRRNADATRAFYNQLSPDQQRTFDRITAQPPGGGRNPG